MTILYVSKTGNDLNNGLTLQTAKLTILNAINSAANNDTIILEEGTYTGNFDINKIITIQGPNVDKNGSSSERILEAILLNTKTTILQPATINGIKFKHTTFITDALIIQSGATIKNCIFERIASVAGQTARGISSSSTAENYKIINNLFTGSLDGGLFSGHKTWNSGIFLTNNGKICSIENNIFNNCRTALNIDNNPSNITCKINDFSNCGTYISYGGTVQPTTGMITENNIFNISTLGSVLINNSNVSTLFRSDISLNKFKINNVIYTSEELSLDNKFIIEGKLYHKGISSKNGIIYFSQNEQFVISGLTTIQTAITYAPQTNETIYIYPGTYSENLTINKSIKLSGTNKDTTIIQSTYISTVPTIQFTDGSSDLIIENLTIKGRVNTLSTTGSGDSSNNNSAIYCYTTDNTNMPAINNITLNNLIIRNASNGICFNNKISNNISITNCLITNNEGSGIRIATNTETMNGLILDSCTISENNLNAINSNPSGTYRPNCTNYTICNCSISNNNKLTVNNSHDISFFGFNGNIEINNTMITSNHYESKQINGTSTTTGGWGLIIYGSNQSSILRNSGNITLNNLVLSGNVIKSGMGIERYSSIGNIYMNNVNIKNYNVNKANQTWIQFTIGHNDIINSFNIRNTHLKTLAVTQSGDIDASKAYFYNILTNELLNRSIFEHLTQIANQIIDKSDNSTLGNILIKTKTVSISPSEPNSINTVITEVQNDTTINLVSGEYNISSISSSINKISLKTLTDKVIIKSI